MRDGMKFARRRFEIAAAAGLALCGFGKAAQAQLTAIDLEAVNSLYGGTISSMTPLALNSSDQVVGYYSTSAGQQAFIYTPGLGVSTLPAGTAGYNNEARGINDSGIVVGTYGGGGATKAFYYNASSGASSVSQILPIADSNNSTSYTGANITPYAINNNGLVTGSSSVATSTTSPYNPSSDRTFIFNVSAGTPATDVSSAYSGTAIGNSGANSTFGYAINASGEIANYGPTSTGSNTKQPFTLTPNSSGVYTSASGMSLAAAITAQDSAYVSGNNNGSEGIDALDNVVGDYTDGSGSSYGFFYSNASQTATVISDTLGTGSVKIYGISDVGSTPEFVGSAATSSGTHAFLDYGGTMYDLNTIDPNPNNLYTYTTAYAINSSGDILVTGTPNPGTGGTAQAFLLSSSVPEPTSLGLLGIAAMTLLGRRRDRRV